VIGSVLTLITAAVIAQAAPVVLPTDSGLVALSGSWVVDLSVKPDEPYTRPMTLTLNKDGTVSGLFYQSTIDAGRWKTDRNRTCVSFRTHDDIGPYHTTGCLVGDRVEGQTWAEARNFLFIWNAVRAK